MAARTTQHDLADDRSGRHRAARAHGTVGARGPDPRRGMGSLRPEQMLGLQRSVGNAAAAKLLGAGSPIAVQRLAPDPFKKPETAKPGFLKRGGLAIKSFFMTTFGNDPSKIKPETPNVDEATRVEMHTILHTAITDRDARKKKLMHESFLPEDVAEFRANQEAFKDIPESWRPRVVTAAEWQIKKNKTALLGERVHATARNEAKTQALSVDKEVLRKDRSHAFKASLLDKTPEESARLKKEHEEAHEKRAAQKKSVKASQEAGDEIQLKLFEGGLKSMPKEQRAAAQRIYDAQLKKLQAQRKLAKYRELMTGLPAEEIERRTKIYAAKNKLEAGIDTADYDTASSALGGIGSLTKVSSGTAGGSGEIAKLAGNDKVGGVSEVVDGRKVDTTIGTATIGGDVITSAGSVLSSSTTVIGLIKSVQQLDGDPAQQAQADDGIIDGILAIGQNAETLGTQGSSLAKDFGGHAVDSIGMQSFGIPGFDVYANFLQLIRDARRVADNARRAETSKKIISLAGTDDVIIRVVGHVRQRGVHLATHYSVDALAAGLKMAGDIVIMTGVGAVAGAGVKTAGTAVGAVNAAARTVADSYLAGKALAARGEAQLAMPGSAEKLLKDDPLQVSQTIVLRARAGDPLALAALKSFGLDDKALKGSSDANVRALLLARLESSENPETVTGKLTGLLGKIGGGVSAVGAGIRDVFLKPFEIAELRKVKNELNYCGSKDRGVMWGMKQFFTGPGSIDAQKAHIKSVVEKTKLEPQTKARLLNMSLNRQQKQDQAQDEVRQGLAKDISSPKSADPQQMSASALEDYLGRVDLDPTEHARVAVIWLEKRQAETV